MGRCRAALIVAALSLLPCGPASAADAAKAGKSPIIAVLDGQRVLRGSEAAKSIRQVVDARRAQYEAEIETQRKTLKTEEDKLRRQATVLSPEAMRDRRRTLEQKFADLRRQAEQRRGVLTRAFNAAMLRLRQEMARELSWVMDERKIDVTLARTAVLMFDERLNVTDEVVKRLNERLPKIEVSFSPPKKK